MWHAYHHVSHRLANVSVTCGFTQPGCASVTHHRHCLPLILLSSRTELGTKLIDGPLGVKGGRVEKSHLPTGACVCIPGRPHFGSEVTELARSCSAQPLFGR